MTSVIVEQTQSIRVRPFAAGEADEVLAMVGRCSRESLFRRFHGYTDGMAFTRKLLGQGPADEIVVAWWGSRCVGLASLGCVTPGVADIGVLVEDTWQRRGVGRRLTAAVVAAARDLGVATIHADVLGDDRFIVAGLRRIGPLESRIESGAYSVDIALPAALDIARPAAAA